MVKLQELGLAYRKAKVDLYYSSNASLDAIADYEENLESNLSNLLQKINSDDESWVEEDCFLGTWTLVSKSVKMEYWNKYRRENGNTLIFSSPKDEWAFACTLPEKDKESNQEEKISQKPKAEFRVMAKCSLDFHVLSTLWMLKVGGLFDKELSDCSYGNRLRRTKNDECMNGFLGSFKPYLKPYRDWRDKGISAMRTALAADKKIVALTADVASFYHELNAGFMLDQDFIVKVLTKPLDEEQAKLNRLFVRALQAWSQKTPLKKGLPVGLPASGVVANIALIELDRCMERNVVPLYYGRYVDDVLLVMENTSNFGTTDKDFGTTDKVWKWLFDRFEGKLGWVDEVDPTPSFSSRQKNVCFNPVYLNQEGCKSKIHFANDKNKVFILAGESGKFLVDSIAQEIHQRASEWRALPQLPQLAEHVAIDLLVATQSDGENADSLRKADALTMRRSGFAIKLRDFEAYERDLDPGAWVKHRQAFLKAFVDHVMVLPHFFELAIFLPRIVRLATACEDFEYVRKIIDALDELCEQLKNCDIVIKAESGSDKGQGNSPHTSWLRIHQWSTQIFLNIRESIVAAFPIHLSKEGKKSYTEHMACKNGGSFISNKYEAALLFSWPLNLRSWPTSVKDFQKQQARLFSFDLAHMPFRFLGLPKEMVTQRGIPAKKTVTYCHNAEQLLDNEIIAGTQTLNKWLQFEGIPNGILFATRPFSLPELFILNKDAYNRSTHKAMQDVVLAIRGFNLSDSTPCFNNEGVLQVPSDNPLGKYRVAVSSWQTDEKSWRESVLQLPDTDCGRYKRLCCLLNDVIAQPHETRYLVFPELALPAHWFVRIARKLHPRGISLIAGIEYLHVNKARVRNQVWLALSHNGLGFPSLIIYRQDKQYPALHEEQELHQLAGLKMKPEKTWTAPPIIQHGDLRFALLICSELTNLNYRAALRGRVDALFVPEWNCDTETFDVLVESAALDVHAYIVQCNNREYGDSRIRAPFKDSWKRDVLRVKGGVSDYCVIGEIDVLSLRQFQSSYRSPIQPFKPVPDGFNDSMDYNRKVLPQ